MLLVIGFVAVVGVPSAAVAGSRSTELADQPGVVVDRSEFTTTTATADGERHTRVSPEAVNFEESKGRWEEIDPTLEPVGGGDVSPAAVDGDAVIPPSLSQALELTHDGRSLSFRLRGARGGRAVSGSKARFDNVLSGVDAVYSARSGGLKETLVLRDHSAPTTFTYDLTADADLEAAILPGGELVLRDRSGDVQFQISAPLAWDSAATTAYSDALKLTIEPNGPGKWTLVMAPDEAWLASPNRVYPVSVDPDWNWSNGATRFHGANTDCYLSSGNQATTNFCAATTFKIGSSATNAFKANLRFDVAQAIPTTASVTEAEFVAFQPGSASHAGSDTRLRAITSDWNGSATWNNRKTSTPWTTAGGDVTTDAAMIGPARTVFGAGYWYYWTAPLAAVSGWVAGTLPNYGLQLATDAGSPANNTYTFTSTEGNQASWPALDVTWTPGDATPPALALSGPATVGQDTWRTTDTTSVTLAASDAGKGVVRLEVLKGTTVIASAEQACAAGACSMTRTLDLDLVALGEGQQALKAAAIDGQGLRQEEAFVVNVDRAAPTLAITGTLVDNQAVSAATGTRSAHIVSADAGAGVVSLKLAVDGTQQQIQTQPCAAGACGLTKDWIVDLAPLSAGPHTVRITATDGAGRETIRDLQIQTDTYAMPAVPPLSQTQPTPFEKQVDFLWTGSNPLQTGVEAGTIDTKRVSVLTGTVFDGEGAPLGGVVVSVVGHPEYGQTISRSNGKYFLGVNGGSKLRVRFARQGSLDSEREVQVGWKDYEVLDDVWLVTADPIGTPVTFGAAATTMQVANSSVISDADGSRTTRLFVRPGTTATKKMIDGSTALVPAGTVRVTEYTAGAHGPERMPASLPEGVAYTYAAEFQVDGATGPNVEHVLFSKPVVSYVDNFLHLPVGADIPVGTYEPGKGKWAGDPDGRVLKILSESGGRAVVDVTGFGAANAQELSFYNIDDAELQKLAENYEPGDTLWRVEMGHFSAADYNHMVAIPRRWKAPKKKPIATQHDRDCNKSGSIIGCKNQTLGETADLGGTPYALRYDSARTPGAVGPRSVLVPLTEDTIPESVLAVNAQVIVAGQRYTYTVEDLEPNLSHLFRWDGKDAFGRPLVGGGVADVRIQNLYPAPYTTRMSVPQLDRNDVDWVMLPYFGAGTGGSWGTGPGQSVGGLPRVTTPATPVTAAIDRPALDCNAQETVCTYPATGTTIGASFPVARENTPLTSEFTVNLPYADGRSMGVGGWGLSVQHRYDSATGTLFTGDGEQRSAASLPDVVHTVRDKDGTDNDPDLALMWTTNDRIAALPDGSVLRTERVKRRVLREWPSGHTTVFAGDPAEPFDSGDGGPATAAGLRTPSAVAVGPDGSVYIGDASSNIVRRVDLDGTIHRFAGSGALAAGGEETNPLQRGLAGVNDLAVASDGTVYIADGGGLLAVSPAGKIGRLAGLSYYRCGGTNEACTIESGAASNVAVAPDGTVYWTSSIGNGSAYYNRFRPGDSGADILADASYDAPATEGLIAETDLWPEDIAVDAAGRLLIVDRRGISGGVWRLGADNRVTRIGGRTDCASQRSDGIYQGEGGAFAAACGEPAAIAQGVDGVFVLEGTTLSGQLRKVTPALQRYPVGESLVPAEDGSELYRFDINGQHLETLDATTGRSLRSFTYDNRGRLAIIQEADFGTTTFEYGGIGIDAPVTVTGPDGQVTTLTLDANGWATKITDAKGASQKYEYGPEGLMTRYEDQLGHASAFTYNAAGRLLTDSSPSGKVQTLTRAEGPTSTEVEHESALSGKTSFLTERDKALASGSTGVKTTRTEPDGSATVREVADGSQSEVVRTADGTKFTKSSAPDPRFHDAVSLDADTVVRPSGLTSSSAHSRTVNRDPGQDPNNPFAVETIVDTYAFNGSETTSTFDREARTLTARSPLGRESVVQLDAYDRPTRISAPGRDDVEVTYDQNGRPATATQGGQTARTEYGAGGRLSKLTDQNGGVTTIGRDLNGRPTTVAGPDAQTTTMTYDAAGQITALTGPSGRAFSFTYDSAGNVTAASRTATSGSGAPALVGHVNYDNENKPTTVTAPSGKTVAMTYDAAGRQTKAEAADGTTQTSDYEPTGAANAAGRLKRVTTDAGLATSFGYDGELVTQIRTAQSSGTDALDVNLEYNAAQIPRRETVADSAPVDYVYDAEGALLQAGDLGVSYNPATGDPTAATAGATTTRFGVDSHGQVSSVVSVAVAPGAQEAGVLSEAVSRDALGRIATRVEKAGALPAKTFSYAYSSGGKLSSVSIDGSVAETYSYDATGSLVARGTGILSSSYTVDGYGRPVSSAGGLAATWSTDGELQTYTRPGVGQTTAAYDGLGRTARLTLPDGKVGVYQYDGLGRRAALRIDGQLVRRYAYGGELFPRARVDADGSVLERYVYGSKAHVPELIIRRDGQRLRLVTDSVGSVRAVVDTASGAVVQRLSYDAYGKVTQDTAPGTQPFGFKGSMGDPAADAAGLTWMGVRAYVPGLARFATADPAGFAAGWNQHDAFKGDPINLTDADGMFPGLNDIGNAFKSVGKGIWNNKQFVLGGLAVAACVAAVACLAVAATTTVASVSLSAIPEIQKGNYGTAAGQVLAGGIGFALTGGISAALGKTQAVSEGVKRGYDGFLGLWGLIPSFLDEHPDDANHDGTRDALESPVCV